VIAAGHPLTAEAGAEVLRAGGNAVDAAVGAVLTSFAVESPLTGFGAGGFMLVHAGSESVLLDFFVEMPGREPAGEPGALVPVSVYFDETPQVFNVGPASCGVPGNPAGLARALERWGTMPLAELVKPGVRHAREGAPLNAQQAYILKILEPIMSELPESRALYAPGGTALAEGETFSFPELAEALERYAAEGPAPFYTGEVARRLAEWVGERGGLLGAADLAAYEPVEREPVNVSFRGREVLTNPPPSSGGLLIAYSLAQLERLGASGVEQVVAAMAAAGEARTEEFHAGLYEPGYAGRLLGSTTHIAALDASGMCASVTCSNGSGSGVVVPGTGVHLNNMLGEEDLNPLGFHALEPGRRITSMMAPTVVLEGGEVVLGLGSAGSNRLRSAILQTIARVVDEGLDVGDAVEAPRVHFEDEVVQAEPGVDEAALARLESQGRAVARWKRQNLYFGGVQAVARDPATGALTGAGDPRRGGTAIVVQ